MDVPTEDAALPPAAEQAMEEGATAPPPALAAAGADPPAEAPEGEKADKRKDGEGVLWGTHERDWTRVDSEVAFKVKAVGSERAAAPTSRDGGNGHQWLSPPGGDGEVRHRPLPPGFERAPMSGTRPFQDWLRDLRTEPKTSVWAPPEGGADGTAPLGLLNSGPLDARPKTVSRPVGREAGSVSPRRQNGGDAPQGGPGERLAGGKLAACLLYTSPSPRDKRQSRMPSSA